MATYVLTIGGVARTLATDHVILDKLTVSYDGPREFQFTEHGARFSPTYDEHESVQLTIDGTTYFLGEITEIQHEAWPDRVSYTALGLRYKASQVDLLDSSPAVPRYIYNADKTDTDYAASRAAKSVGQILKEWFDNDIAALRAADCAPAAPGVPYVQAELDLLTVVSPEKLVFENAKFAEAVEDLLQHQPYVVWYIDPATKVWHFKRVEDLTAHTVTFQSDEVYDDMLQSSVDGCRTAYQIYGELQQITRWAYLSKGDLTESWNAAKEADWDLTKAMEIATFDSGVPTSQTANTVTDSGASWGVNDYAHMTAWLDDGTDDEIIEIASNTATALTLVADHNLGTILNYEIRGGESDYRPVWSRYQVTAADKRNMARWNKRGAPFIAKNETGSITTTNRIWEPVVYAVYTVNNSLGQARELWLMVQAAFDHPNGIFLTHVPLAAFGPGTYALVPGDATAPTDVVLIYEYMGTNLSARYPACGYTGTAYTSAGVESIETVYIPEWQDEADQSQYDTLAEERLKSLKDIRYRGTLNIIGIQTTYANLGYKMGLAAVDGSGNPVTTNWESIAALLRNVTYNWQDDVHGPNTVLEIDSDLRGFAGERPIRSAADRPTPYYRLAISATGDATATRWSRARGEWIESPVGAELTGEGTREKAERLTGPLFPEPDEEEWWAQHRGRPGFQTGGSPIGADME